MAPPIEVAHAGWHADGNQRKMSSPKKKTSCVTLARVLPIAQKSLLRVLPPFRSLVAVARELGILFVAGMVYLFVRETSQGDAAVAAANAYQLKDLEVALGIGREQAVQDFALRHDLISDLSNWVYVWGHWPVIAVCSISLFMFYREGYRFLRNAVIASGLLGFFFFAFLPMTPPRLLNDSFIDTVSATSRYHEVFQPPAYTNPFAAMPSLHFGWNLLLGIVLFITIPSLLVKGFAVLMPMAMAFSVVATANHWMLDVVVGLFVALAGLGIAVLMRRFERRHLKAAGQGDGSGQEMRPVSAHS